MPHEERHYALDVLEKAGNKAEASAAEMAALRKTLDEYMEKDRKRAKNIHTALKKQKEMLLENLSEMPLPLLEAGMEELSAYTLKLISSVKAFRLMTPDYSKLEAAVKNLISKLPQNNQNVSVAVIGRLMNHVKMGYYPTDMEHLAHIRRAVSFPEGITVNLLDPYCGKGTALSALGADADCMTYGVEIDEGRAESALSRLTRVGFGSYFYSRISRQAFHAMLLNPPYLSTVSECGWNVRSEKRFLAESYQHLMMGGLLIYIIPHYRLTQDVCTVLCENFRDITVWKFYGKEYERFSQIAVMGIRREREKCSGAAGQLGALVYDMDAVPELSEIPDGRYALPEQAKKVDVFQGEVFNKAELAAQLAASKSFAKIFEKNRIDTMEKHPLLPFGICQIGLVGGSGLINGFMDCKAPHIIKGRIVKEKRTRQEENQKRAWGSVSTIYETDVNKMVFNILTPEGFRSLS